MAFVSLNRSEISASMNITPLVDVMLVLLVIFMVTAPMPTNVVALETPPKCYSCPDKKKEEPARLEILRDGKLRWDGNFLDREGLEAQLLWLSEADTPLLIASADDTQYSDVASVLALVAKAKIQTVAIAN